MRIALDAMGGDLAPKATVEGAVLAARDFGTELVLVGDRDVLAKELGEYDTRGLKIDIQHAAEAVAMDESPLESVLSKPNSSIHFGLEMLKRGDVDAFVSAGNSGAVMTAAMVILGTLPGVDRPAIASPVPTSAGYALLIDAGANTEVKPLNLVQFGLMGSVYFSRVGHAARPSVGILSNGEEASKGNDLTRAAAAMLGQMSPYVNYIGYVEGRDINRGTVDVVVTDGFTGNVTLKTMEGLVAFLVVNLRQVFDSSWRGRLSYLLLRKKLQAVRERLDPSEYGGAPLLGVNGVAIMAHGSSNGRAIRNAIRAAANEALVRHVNAEIVELLAKSPSAAAARPGGKGIRAIFSRMRDRFHLHGRDAYRGRRAQDRYEAERGLGEGDEHPEDRLPEEESKEAAKPGQPFNGASAATGTSPDDRTGNLGLQDHNEAADPNRPAASAQESADDPAHSPKG